METNHEHDRLQIYDLLEQCAEGAATPEDVCSSIVSFSKSDAAPDTQILSDLLLDTLFLYESGVSLEDESSVNGRRDRLGLLVANLIDQQCVNEQDAYERLEPPLLFAASLIPDAKAFEKRHVKINTNLLYRQQKFNLLREENEGYSKIVVEFEAFLASTANTPSESKARELLTNIQSLIGYFDLDPNRILDVLLEMAAAHLVSHWRFLVTLFHLSPWFSDDDQDTIQSDIQMGDLQSSRGNQSAAQIMGFKFQQIRQKTDDASSLIMLAAIMTKEGLIKLKDLWPHLAPTDTAILEEKSMYQNRILDEVDKAKGRNALAMSGGLDEDVPAADTKLLKEALGKSASEGTALKDNKHKIDLIQALLEVGALSESLFLLSEFSFLLSSNQAIATAWNGLIECMIAPLWAQTRPQCRYPEEVAANLQQEKRVPEDAKYRDSNLVLPHPPQIEFVLHPSLESRSVTVSRVFFYDEVSSHLSLCTAYDEFETRVLPYVRLAGVQIHRSTELCTKLAKIGKLALLRSNHSEDARKIWRSILRVSLLPALSLIEANPAFANDVHSLVKEYSTEDRYALYGEWFVDSYRRIPELKIQFVKTEKETRSLLRRISKTNTKEYGRRLAKVSHSNPCIVLNIALNQIESYDNLVDVVIEASRYFTLLTFDVLVYIMLTLLSNTQKRRLKDDGTSVAHWLQSLSSFTAKIFKRYSHMDASPICIYVAKQLKMNNAFDLIILRDLISEMAGLRPNSDLSEDQLQGCTGGPCLKVEALALINERRDPSAKAPARLLYALEKTDLIYRLPILIGQQRTHCVYNVPEEQSLLKLLANLADEVSQIFLQYLEFLTLNIDVGQYGLALPSVSSLVKDTSLEPAVAFMLARPALQAEFHHLNHSRSTSDLDTENQDTIMLNADVTEPATIIPMEIDPQEKIPDIAALSLFQKTALDVRSIFPDETWSYMDPEFYAAFWILSSYDLSVPTKRYQKEIDIARQQLTTLNADKTELTNTENRLKKAELSKIEQTLEALSSELSLQHQNHTIVLKLVETRKANWFDRAQMAPSSADATEWRIRSAACLVQHCLLPRCLSSANDASYSASMLKLLHDSAVPHLNVMRVYGQLFGPQLATTIFSSTEREAENLGRFLNEILKRLNHLSENEAAYDLARVRFKFPESPEYNESTEFMPWDHFKELWYKGLHRSIWTNVKACFGSKEYMNVRNVLIVLERMQGSLPYFKWIGKNIEKEVDLMISTERREDLKIRALGYKAVLKKQKARWHEAPKSSGAPEVKAASTPASPSANGVNQAQQTTEEAPKQQDASSLDPDVPEFEPNSIPIEASTPATIAPALQTSDAQREAAKRKAAILSQELRAKQNTLRSTQDMTTTTVQAPAVPSKGSSITAEASSRPPVGRVRDEDRHTDASRSRTSHSRQASRPSSPRNPGNQEIGRPQRAAESRDYRDSPRHIAPARRGDPAPRQVLLEDDYTTRGIDQRSRVSSTDRTRAPFNENISSTRHMRPPQSAAESTVGRLNGSDHDNNDYSRGLARTAKFESRDDVRDIQDTRGSSSHSGREQSQKDSDINELNERMANEALPRSRGRSAMNSERVYDQDAARNVPDGPRSLSSRMTSNSNGAQSSSVPRNAPDGPRRARSPIDERPNSLAPRAPFVHPSREAPLQGASQTIDSPSKSTPSRSEYQSARNGSSAPTEIAVHPSRQQSLKLPSSDDSGRAPRSNFPDNAQSSKNSNYGAGESRQSGPRGRDEPSSRSSARDSREVRHREPDSRDMRDTRASSARDSRGGARSDSRQVDSGDAREGRLERMDGRRERIVDRRDEMEGKRRHASDSRESSRPTKQRRH